MNERDDETITLTWIQQIRGEQSELDPMQAADARSVLSPTLVNCDPAFFDPWTPGVRRAIRVILDSYPFSAPQLVAGKAAIMLRADPERPGTPVRCPKCGRVYAYLADPRERFDFESAGSEGLPCAQCLAEMPGNGVIAGKVLDDSDATRPLEAVTQERKQPRNVTRRQRGQR